MISKILFFKLDNSKKIYVHNKINFIQIKILVKVILTIII